MSRIVLALLMIIPAASAQNALWVDLAGTWLGTFGDRPEFASPQLDDSHWPEVNVPGNHYRLATHWMRRRVTLPEGADFNRLAMTLGARQDAYEVYVNGVLIGATDPLTLLQTPVFPGPEHSRSRPMS